MMSFLYILTGSAFYWLAYRNAYVTEDQEWTHPQAEGGETIYLFPEEPGLRAA
jgi:hypothetical protein